MATETVSLTVTYDDESDYGDGGPGTAKVKSIEVGSTGKVFNLRSGKPFSMKTFKKYLAQDIDAD